MSDTENDSREEIFEEIGSYERKLKAENEAHERRLNAEEEARRLELARKREAVYEMLLLLLVGLLFFFIAWLLQQVVIQNPDLFEIKKETTDLLRNSIEILVVSVVPFFFGLLGGASRILASGEKFGKYIGALLFSGLAAVFAWIGLKSKLVLALLFPYLETKDVDTTTISSEFADAGASIYSFVFVAILVGLFSSTIFLAINDKVERILLEKRSKE